MAVKRKIMDKVKKYANQRNALAYMIIVLPIVYGFAIIYKYGVNQPFWDDWDSLSLFFSFKENNFSFSNLLKYHNGHCIFFPNIILTLSAILSNGNMKADMYIVMVLMSVIYIIWILALKQMDKHVPILVIAFMACFTFNSVQYDNILWGFQVGFLLTACTMLATVFSFSKMVNTKSKKYFVMVILFGVIAAFSSAQGIIAFLVICLCCMIMSIKNKKVTSEYIAIWGVFLICLCIYSLGYSSSEGTKSLIGIIDFFIALIGAPLSTGSVMAARVIGLMMLAATVIIVIHGILSDEFEVYVFEYSTMIMTLGVLAAMALGRSEFGSEYAVATSRYTTFSLWVYQVVVLYYYKKSNKRYVRTVGIIIGLLIGIGTNIFSFKYFDGVRSFRREVALYMNNYDSIPLEWLYNVYPWNKFGEAYEDIQKYYNAINSENKKLFAEVPIMQGVTDDNEVMWGIRDSDFKNDDRFYYTNSGWIFGINDSVEDVHIRIGKKEYQAWYGRRRIDVNDAYNTDSECGILFSIAKDTICEGDTVEIVAIMKNGSVYTKTIGAVKYN